MNKRVLGAVGVTAAGAIAVGLMVRVGYLSGDTDDARVSPAPATPAITVDKRTAATFEPVVEVEPALPELTLERIFDGMNRIGTPSGGRVTTVLFGGDVMLGRSVNAFTHERGFDWPYREIKSVLSEADLTVVNLESPFAEPCPVTHDGMVFCGNVAHAGPLAASGVDLVNLANNHVFNYGAAGVQTTVVTLGSVGIETYGQDGPVYREVAGTRFAFLGYNDVGFTPTGIAELSKERLRRDVAEARQSADVVVVTPHWGVEYVIEPTEGQRELARSAIDSGADLVIGHHPHRVQIVEIYQGKLIAYSLGNLVFDQMWSEETRQGMLMKTAFYRDRLVDVDLLPVNIFDYGQPRLMTREESSAVLKTLYTASTASPE